MMENSQEPQINGVGVALINTRLDGLEKLIEHRFAEIITDNNVTNTRLEERKRENEKLRDDNSKLRERVTKLETAQVTTRWLIGASIAAAGAIATAVAIFV